ncbi:MAG: hypothetical protein ACTHNU_02575 [Gaiellales bacterium]
MLKQSVWVNLREVNRLAVVAVGIVGLLAMSGVARASTPPLTLPFNHDNTACASVSGHNLRKTPSQMSQTGIAFDGSRLLISCWGDTTITAIDPNSGNELHVYHVTGVGFNAQAYGALAYDHLTGQLWACASTDNHGTGSPENKMSEVGLIDLSSSTFTPVFNASSSHGAGCDNGLGWDPGSAPGRADTLWTSGDLDTVVQNWTPNVVQGGATLNEWHDVASLMGATPATSGIVFGGGKFYIPNQQTTTKRLYSLTPDFTGYADKTEPILTSGNRYEDLECDDVTFAPQTVIWVMWFNQNILKPFPIAGTCTASAQPQPNLTIAQSSNSPVTAGQSLTFTDTVTNTGQANATHVSLSETLPGNAAFVSATPSTGSCTQGSSITCSLGTLSPNQSARVNVTFSTLGPGTVSSGATASSDQTSPVSASQPATVTAAPGVFYETVGDSGITPLAPQVTVGKTVRFLIQGSTAHSIADGSPFALFSSGLLTPPAAFDYTYAAAGAYPVIDGTTGATTTVQMVTDNPASGSLNTPFQVTWATHQPPAGFVEDVQVLNPGTTTWVPFVSGSTDTSAMFTPAQTGTYKFRARYRDTGTGHATAYSVGHSTVIN